MSKFAHFGLSLLAVLLGIPLSIGTLMIFSFLFIFMIGILISASFAGSSNTSDTSLKYNYSYAYGNRTSENKIVSISVQGPIVSQSSAGDPLSSIFGIKFADGELIKEQLRDAANDSSVKGVILEIDSPGGIIPASKAISDGADYVRNAKKPIIAHVNGSGTSGAYWSAVSTDYIVAETGSISVNVGVILGDIPYFKSIIALGDVATQEPITFNSFSAGKYKDIGNPYREMSQPEKDSLNKLLNNEYDTFVNYVSARRNVPVATIKDTIGALPYGNKEAIELKMIDKEGSKEVAYEEIGSRIGAKDGDFVIEKEQYSGNFFGTLFGAVFNKQVKAVKKDTAINKDARIRYCASLTTKPLAVSGGLDTFCK